MKRLLAPLALSIFFISFTDLQAQDFQGKAVYQTKSTVPMDFGNTQMSPDRVQRIKDMMKNQLEKSFVLHFDKTASVYKEEQKLDQSNRGGWMRFMMGQGVPGDHYKNTQTHVSVKESEFSGRNFLIKDPLTDYKWTLTQESKMIGQYLCFKATTVIERPKPRPFRMGPPDKRSEAAEAAEVAMESVNVTAWYAMEIPVNHGPDNYWGLPGLILEVSAGNTTILCTKIVMNSQDKVRIEEPSKGKELTQKAFDELVRVQLKKMRERYRNERQKSGGNRRF